MITILNVTNWLLPLLYGVLLIEYGAAFFLRVRSQGRSPWLAAVVVVHLGFLALLAAQLGRLVPVTGFEVLSALAVATAAVYALTEFLSRERRIGGFVLLVVFLLQYTASVFLPRGGWLPDASGDHRFWTQLHVLPAIVAYMAFTLSAVLAVLHLLAHGNLKHRKFGLLFDRLPPLELLGRMTGHSMGLGLIFLTVALLGGALMFGGAGQGLPTGDVRLMIKIFGGSLAWVIYAVALGGLVFGKWSTVRVSRVSLLGYLMVVVLLVTSVVL